MDPLQADAERFSDADLAIGTKVGVVLPVGHAWFVIDDDENDEAMLLACERREPLDSLLKHVGFNLRARTVTVIIEGVSVPVVVVMLRFQGSQEPALFSAFVNALSPRTSGILNKLATQPNLPVVLVDECGRTVGTSLIKNVLIPRINSLRDCIEDLAKRQSWTCRHLAADKAHVRSQHPTNEDLWGLFEEETAEDGWPQELAELLA